MEPITWSATRPSASSHYSANRAQATPHLHQRADGEAFTRFAINKMIGTAGQNAKITWPVHPHCLRHTTGTMQANGGMDAWRLSKLMGHASIANAAKYVRMSPEPLKDAWRGKR